MFLFGFHSIQQAEMGAAMDALEKCKIFEQQTKLLLVRTSVWGAGFMWEQNQTQNVLNTFSFWVTDFLITTCEQFYKNLQVSFIILKRVDMLQQMYLDFISSLKMQWDKPSKSHSEAVYLMM